MFLDSKVSPYIFIIFAVLVALLIVVNRLLKKMKEKAIRETLEYIASLKGAKLLNAGDKRYDYIIETEKEKIFIKLAIIPSNSSVTVNSKNTWCLRFGGGTRSGRNYPNQEYMNDLKPFLNANFKCEKVVRRVVILYPTTEHILKYVNESDIIELKETDLAYGVQIVRYEHAEKFL